MQFLKKDSFLSVPFSLPSSRSPLNDHVFSYLLVFREGLFWGVLKITFCTHDSATSTAFFSTLVVFWAVQWIISAHLLFVAENTGPEDASYATEGFCLKYFQLVGDRQRRDPPSFRTI